MKQGMPWPFGIDPGTCPIYFGLPWGLAIPHCRIFPYPYRYRRGFVPQLFFERYGKKARYCRYVSECYEKVCYLMQATTRSISGGQFSLILYRKVGTERSHLSIALSQINPLVR
jgi:hypothetical protein